MAMPVVGSARTPMATLFQAKFTVNELLRTFNASLNSNILFSSDIAMLTYGKEDDLTGDDTYTGTAGATLEVNLGKGPKITGTIVPPFDPPIPISGGGTWASS
ncbi:uncharacterized protein PHACADRAFT_263139 [Phanerochaete carnosa HHB-10118-sp]|uniref:Uncharacterized protein n=1 Tax=Phanerochaete carnosa (strain HHB-10118-sp) TaxID=650164 RepID=K5VWE8_PHACS|nr:uncharacterized protein PHACADRAFT_263139 [Phanerochaete carnosa HHB-10118-sp]EKM51145.1 hypothetical protein PHACADRAFT_263139 [Phanerochaete carnosa HHB-10118-sp]